MSPVLSIYRLLTGLAEPLAPALLRGRVRRGKEDPARLGERLGRASAPRPEGELAWLHGASVGEALSLLPLVERLKLARPDLAVLVTSGTTTSAELLARRLPVGVIHQYAPVDTPGAARRFLDHWRPDLVVFVESEFWPNLLLAAKARGGRLAALSARMGESSARNWSRAPKAARTLLGAFDLILPQDSAAAARLSRLGGRDDGRLNLKLMGAAPPYDAKTFMRMKKFMLGGRSVLLAASTHPGEEELALEAFQGLTRDHPTFDALLIIVPRHPVRGPEIAVRARDMGFKTVLRSEAGEDMGGARADVWVADTLGELGLWFMLADSAFIGGSLVDEIGGHNPLEAARLDRPIVVGPHVANWAAVYAQLRAAGGLVEVEDAAGLDQAWRRDIVKFRDARVRASRAKAAARAGDADLDAAVAQLLGLIR
jgi:3-deoxy-D-manno-octulosonic-acid transferase